MIKKGNDTREDKYLGDMGVTDPDRDIVEELWIHYRYGVDHSDLQSKPKEPRGLSWAGN